MPPPSLNSSAVPTSAVNGNWSIKQFVFTHPAGNDVKLTVSTLIVVAAAVGFVGNLFVLRFTNNEEKKPVRARSSTLNFFIRSLALSDVLGSLIGAPFVVTYLNFDVFMTKWSCSISRFFQTVFVFITNYNLVVIAVERYICTCRPTSRPLSSRTVREAVKAAWLLGFLFSLGFSCSMDAVRVDLNSTHYTLVCEYNFTTTVGIISQQVRALLTYIIPIIIQTFTCVSIWRMLCTRQQQEIGAQNNLEAIRKWNIRRKKATIELLAIIMAYTIPCSMFFIWSVLRSIFAQLSLEFKTDYTIRLVAVLFLYLNGCVNFVIHLAQLVGFRKAMQGYLSYLRCCKCECKTAGQTRTMNHTAQKEPKSPPAAVKGDNKRRASMSQVQDAEERQETQTRRHSC